MARCAMPYNDHPPRAPQQCPVGATRSRNEITRDHPETPIQTYGTTASVLWASSPRVIPLYHSTTPQGKGCRGHFLLLCSLSTPISVVQVKLVKSPLPSSASIPISMSPQFQTYIGPEQIQALLPQHRECYFLHSPGELIRSFVL